MNGKFIHSRKSGKNKRLTNNGTSPSSDCEVRRTRNFRFVRRPDAVKISGQTRGLSHFRRIASADCQYLTDDALATRPRRHPKPRESTWKPTLFRTADCSAYQRRTLTVYRTPRRFEPEFAFTRHSPRSRRSGPTDYPARVIRARWPIISPRSLELSPERIIDRILSEILIMSWRIARR